MNTNTDIAGFHAHIYFDTASRETAARVREGLGAKFDVRLGRWHEQPVGPPLKSSFSQLLQTSDDTLLEEAILLYRSRFSTIGLFENRLHDIIGAKKNNIASIGVTYGYGSREELETHKADLIADCPKEIPTLLPLI